MNTSNCEPEHTVLVVDDDANVVELARLYLERDGYRVVSASDGARGLALAREEQPSLVVLDVMLPRVNGLDVCRALRQESAVPIIMLTARVEEDDRLAGLDLGADDYVTKPFSPRELAARVRAVLRRAARDNADDESTMLSCGPVELDQQARRVTVGGSELRLTPTEFRLLALLMRQPGRTFTRDEIIDRVLGDDFDGFDRTVDAHVSSLRRKLSAAPGGRAQTHPDRVRQRLPAESHPRSPVSLWGRVRVRTMPNFRSGLFASLQFRLALGFVLALGLALALIGVAAGVVADEQARRFERDRDQAQVARVRQLVADYYARRQNWGEDRVGLQAFLERAGPVSGAHIQVYDARGALIADSHAYLPAGREGKGRSKPKGSIQKFPVFQDGQQVGAFTVSNAGLPAPDSGNPVLADPLASRIPEVVNRSLLWAGISAAALGTLLVWLLSRRTLAPLQALGAAAPAAGPGRPVAAGRDQRPHRDTGTGPQLQRHGRGTGGSGTPAPQPDRGRGPRAAKPAVQHSRLP